MTMRWLPVFLAFWLLAGPQGAGLHMHRHQHQHGVHSHLASSFDAEHALAHAAGAIDGEECRWSPRPGSKPPSSEPAVPPRPPELDPGTPAVAFLIRHELHLTGPPPRLRPPGQAPPSSIPFA